METSDFPSEFMQLISLTYCNHLHFWPIYDTIRNMTVLHHLCNAIKCHMHIRDDKLRQELDDLVCLKLYRKCLGKLGTDQLIFTETSIYSAYKLYSGYDVPSAFRVLRICQYKDRMRVHCLLSVSLNYNLMQLVIISDIQIH